MKVKVVIGANYGDEGKGLMTDYFVRQEKNPLVIRFNGGAQAGHTVNNGKIHHIFSHIGSGALAGAPTFLSEHFVVNPLIFSKEREELINKGVVWNRYRHPKIFVDLDCRVTTPFDMLINQKLEESRGDGRHGSVGIGFGETIEQSERYEDAFKFDYLYDTPDEIYGRLVDIEKNWYRPRLEELGLEEESWNNDFYEGVRKNFVNHAISMRNWVDGVLDMESIILEKNHTLIFEGAQGLLLDQDGKDFPHVTRSFTGLTNVDHLLRKNEIKVDDDSEVVYVSRAYMTRHGAGPLKEEVKDPGEIGFDVVDETNKHGDYQGSLRFAPLYIDELVDRIHDDADKNGWLREISIAVTCVDQADDFVRYGSGGFKHTVARPMYLNLVKDFADYISMGPTWRDVVETRHIQKFNQMMKGG